jgi:hypothetical protein
MALGDGAGRVRQITGAAVPFFADRVQEGDKQTGLGRTWSCPVLLIADEKADMATSTRMTRPGHHDVASGAPGFMPCL